MDKIKPAGNAVAEIIRQATPELNIDEVADRLTARVAGRVESQLYEYVERWLREAKPSSANAPMHTVAKHLEGLGFKGTDIVREIHLTPRGKEIERAAGRVGAIMLFHPHTALEIETSASDGRVTPPGREQMLADAKQLKRLNPLLSSAEGRRKLEASFEAQLAKLDSDWEVAGFFEYVDQGSTSHPHTKESPRGIFAIVYSESVDQQIKTFLDRTGDRFEQP